MENIGEKLPKFPSPENIEEKKKESAEKGKEESVENPPESPEGVEEKKEEGVEKGSLYLKKKKEGFLKKIQHLESPLAERIAGGLVSLPFLVAGMKLLSEIQNEIENLSTYPPSLSFGNILLKEGMLAGASTGSVMLIVFGAAVVKLSFDSVRAQEARKKDDEKKLKLEKLDE